MLSPSKYERGGAPHRALAVYSLTQASPFYPVIPRLREESKALTHLSPPLKPFNTGISSQPPTPSVIPEPDRKSIPGGPLTLSRVEGSSGVGEEPLVLSPSKYERGGAHADASDTPVDATQPQSYTPNTPRDHAKPPTTPNP